MKTWQQLLFGILLGLLAAGGILLLSQPPRGTPITLVPAPTPSVASPPKPSPTPIPITLQISGQVANPGVYQISRSARLGDLITLAGGETNQADIDRINYAALLQDGDYFYIPAPDEVIPETARNAPGNAHTNDGLMFTYPINVNEAPQEAFESLPGIGPIRAAEIIAYREQNGEFTSIEDLLNVPGIGPSILETIREFLTVEP